MSKKTTEKSSSTFDQTQARQFDPGALGTYQGLQPQIGATLGDFMANPWQSGFFQNALNRGYESIGGQANVARRNILSPALGASISNPNAFMASQLGKISRGASRQKSDLLSNLLLGSGQLRMQAAQAAQGYQPLETGQTASGSQAGTKTSTTGGLGSWLPQVIGAAASIGLAPFTGGTSLMGLGGLGSMFGGAAGAASSAMSPVYNSLGPAMATSPFAMSGLNAYQPGYQKPWF